MLFEILGNICRYMSFACVNSYSMGNGRVKKNFTLSTGVPTFEFIELFVFTRRSQSARMCVFVCVCVCLCVYVRARAHARTQRSEWLLANDARHIGRLIVPLTNQKTALANSQSAIGNGQDNPVQHLFAVTLSISPSRRGCSTPHGLPGTPPCLTAVQSIRANSCYGVALHQYQQHQRHQ